MAGLAARTRDAGLRLGIAALTGAALLLAGCGSSAHHHAAADVLTSASSPASSTATSMARSTTTAASSAAPAPSTTASNTATTTSSTLTLSDKNIGTVAYAGSGTVFSANYTLGPIGYGSRSAPPTEVLEACNTDDATILPTEGFIQGTVTFDYSKGAVPLTLGTSTSALNSIDDNVANYSNQFAIDLAGAWVCPNQNQDPGADAITLQPKSDITYPIWIIIDGAVSNASPRLSAAQASVLSLDLGLQSDQTGPNAQETFSGPHAADCNGTDYLLPYASLPLASENCRAVGGR